MTNTDDIAAIVPTDTAMSFTEADAIMNVFHNGRIFEQIADAPSIQRVITADAVNIGDVRFLLARGIIVPHVGNNEVVVMRGARYDLTKDGEQRIRDMVADWRYETESAARREMDIAS